MSSGDGLLHNTNKLDDVPFEESSKKTSVSQDQTLMQDRCYEFIASNFG